MVPTSSPTQAFSADLYYAVLTRWMDDLPEDSTTFFFFFFSNNILRVASQ